MGRECIVVERRPQVLSAAVVERWMAHQIEVRNAETWVLNSEGMNLDCQDCRSRSTAELLEISEG